MDSGVSGLLLVARAPRMREVHRHCTGHSETIVLIAEPEPPWGSGPLLRIRLSQRKGQGRGVLS